MDIDTSRLRTGLPQVGDAPYRQAHAHQQGTATQPLKMRQTTTTERTLSLVSSLMSLVTCRVMRVGPVNNGAWDVGGGWNAESYAAVELIESHSTKEEFMTDYRLYIELLRNLADEAGLPKTLDTDDFGRYQNA